MYNLNTELKKLKKLGVEIVVSRRAPDNKEKAVILENGLRLVPEEDGLILRTANESHEVFAIIVKAPAVQHLAVTIPSGKKGWDVIRLSPETTSAKSNAFIRLVATWSVHGGWSTKYPDNAIRLVMVKNGRLQIWTAAVVTRLYNEYEDGGQGAYHFLVVQEMYEANLYLDIDEKIVADKETVIVTDEQEYGGFNNWEEMQILVETLVDKKNLPALKSKSPSSPDLRPLSAAGKAEVIFFDISKGFGFARTADGAKYFHWSETSMEDRLPYFYSGQLLRYSSISAGPRGEQLLEVQVA